MWHVGDRRCAYRVLVGRPEGKRERDHLEFLDINGKIVIKWIFEKWDGKAWTGLMWLRIETVFGHL
jgi:hypothetical protein